MCIYVGTCTEKVHIKLGATRKVKKKVRAFYLKKSTNKVRMTILYSRYIYIHSKIRHFLS